MEKKTTQRIVGIFIVAVLAIILFPLLFGKTNIPQNSNVTAPPFPNPETAAVSPQPVSEPNQRNTVAENPPVPVPSETIKETTPQPIGSNISNVLPVTSAAELVQQTPPLQQNENKTSEEVASAESDTSPKVKEEKEPAVSKADEITHDIKPKNLKKMHVKKSEPTAVSKIAWVVQLGSFKNKDNARHLANSLRVAGYKAFMHDVKHSGGSLQTRVYIGPESRHSSALKLATKVEKEMKMRGLIVLYRPLEL